MRLFEYYKQFLVGKSIYIHYNCCYSNDPKFSDRQVRANSVDPDQTALEEQSDQSLHSLPFCLHLLDTFSYGKATLFKCKGDYSKYFVCLHFEQFFGTHVFSYSRETLQVSI